MPGSSAHTTADPPSRRRSKNVTKASSIASWSSVVLEVVEVDIGDERKLRLQREEGPEGFVGFGNDEVARARAPAPEPTSFRSPPIRKDGVEARSIERAGEHRRRRRLAVGATNGDAASGVEDIRPSSSARGSTSAPRALRRQNLGIVIGDGVRHDDVVGAADVLGPVAARRRPVSRARAGAGRSATISGPNPILRSRAHAATRRARPCRRRRSRRNARDAR